MSTLLLSGWTQPADALSHLADDGVIFDYSDYGSPEKSFTGLARFRAINHVIAWSQGGQLALRAIAVGALRPKHLTLIAVPYRHAGPEGMGEETFRLFRESYAKDPVRTKARFHALVAKGDRDAHLVTGALKHHPQVDDTVRWLPWLDTLREVDLRQWKLAHTPPTLIIHGMNDQIVAHSQGETLVRLLPKAQLNSWAEVGHAPHLHDAKRLRAEIAAHRKAHKVA